MRSSAGSALESKQMTAYVDSHAHIFSEEFQDDFDAVIQRAKDAHVEQIMIMCTKEHEAEQAIAFARKDPEHYRVAYGIFMDDVDQADARYARFEELIRDPMVAAVGEIGLDYYWVKDNKEAQKALFIRQIESARQVHKPILVHARDAMQDCFDILKEHRIPGVMHCYSGSAEMAVEFTKLGYYIALGGALTFKNSRHAKEVCRAVDPAYLLSETDCPYMAPEPVRGTRNEPCNIPYIVYKMAELRDCSVNDMADQIMANYRRYLKETV